MIVARRFSHFKLISLGFLSIGIFILLQIILPVVSYTFWEMGQKTNDSSLVSPKKSGKGILGISVQNKDNFPSFISNLRRQTTPNYNQFQLSVSRIGLDRETVFVDSNDLSAGLAQLPGSALPGEKGNLFISGHSAVSRFFGGKKGVFAKLSDLKKGDEIIIEAGNSKFVYRVSQIKIVDPSDLSVISTPDEVGRYISLMTCVPPGLNFRRLVVIGEMV